MSNIERPKSSAQAEAFQPIPITSPNDRPFIFWLRCLVDLQLHTIVKQLRPALVRLNGKVIDVGAGESPWRAWLPQGTQYQGIDVVHASDFGMTPENSDIIYYDGRVMPLPSSSFDAALCIEVLEHAEDPQFLLLEISRIMKTNATLILTVPWSARRHHIPHDYYRFTPETLQRLLQAAGFTGVEIRARSSDIGAIANKLTVLTLRLVTHKPSFAALWTWPAGVVSGVLALGFIIAAHLASFLGLGSQDDPLGYFVRATKG